MARALQPELIIADAVLARVRLVVRIRRHARSHGDSVGLAVRG